MLPNFKKTFCYASRLWKGRFTTNKLYEWYWIRWGHLAPCHWTVPILYLLDFCVLEKRLHMNHCMLLGYSFETRPNSRALGTVDSVMTIAESINRCPHSKNLLGEKKQDWLVQKFGLQWLQRLWVGSPFLLLVQEEDKGAFARTVVREKEKTYFG